jgi:hypothetical protein
MAYLGKHHSHLMLKLTQLVMNIFSLMEVQKFGLSSFVPLGWLFLFFDSRRIVQPLFSPRILVSSSIFP